MNHQCVYCESCRKHFVKTDCEERIVDEQEWVADNEDDDSLVAKGKYHKQTILYRICPECGRNDLYDRLLKVTIE